MEALRQYVISMKPISVNDMRKGRTYLTEEYKAFKNKASMELLKQKVEHKFASENRKNFALDITFYIQTVNSSDIDNLAKSVLDACTEAGLWADDRYIFDLYLHKRPREGKSDSVLIKIL